MDINAFTTRLVEIGVLDSKTQLALSHILSKPAKDSRFTAIVENMIGEVEGWHEIASNIRYTSDSTLPKTVAEGVKIILKFAKSNAGSFHIRMSDVED